MANTSFTGPVRSKNNYKLYTTASTGVEQDRTLGTTAKDARRVYLDEWFLQRPGLNANIDQVSTVEVQRALNRNWEAWAGTLWGTENSVHFETSLQIPALDNQKVWAGLKLTNDQLVATDDDQMFFKYQTDATNSEAFDDFAKWHFVHSIGGTDHISVLPITVAVDTPYHFKIEVGSDRKATIFVNGIQYNVTTTSGSTGGTAVTAVQAGKQAVKTAALTDDVDLIPYVGIEAGAAAAEAVNVHYICCSRNVYE